MKPRLSFQPPLAGQDPQVVIRFPAGYTMRVEHGPDGPVVVARFPIGITEIRRLFGQLGSQLQKLGRRAS